MTKTRICGDCYGPMHFAALIWVRPGDHSIDTGLIEYPLEPAKWQCQACGSAEPFREYEYDCFSEAISIADVCGWDSDAADKALRESDGGKWSPELADSLEEQAIEYLRSVGVTVTGYDD